MEPGFQVLIFYRHSTQKLQWTRMGASSFSSLVVWKSSYPSLPPVDIRWSTIHLMLLWILKPLQIKFKKPNQTKTNMSFITQAGEWCPLFRSSQQKSYKEQNGSWISKPHKLGWCKTKRLWLGSASFTGKKPPNKSQDRTILRPRSSKIEEGSVSDLYLFRKE